MVADAARAALYGVILGAATGVPLGVVNVSVVAAARQVGRRHATMIGLGGALADSVHAGLAFAGLAPLLAAQPAVMRGLAIASAVIVIGYAIAIARARPDARPPRSQVGGFATGLVLTLTNPAPLLAWIAVATALLPGASVAVGLAGAVGVGLGSAAWFAVLAAIAARARAFGDRQRRLPQVVAIALIAIAGVALARVW